MMQFTDIILIALFIEAIVNALKPIWSKEGEKLSVSEYVSMGMGVLLAVSCRINMLEWVVQVEYPIWVEYIFYVLTGIAIGRGTNFLYDLWGKLKEWQDSKELVASTDYIHALDADENSNIDLNIDHWSLAQLKDFCALNGINATGCVTRQDYMDAIERSGTTEPPANGGAE